MNRMTIDSFSILQKLFNIGIESVKPLNLINSLSFKSFLKINNYDIPISENVYVVGFGKAALGYLSPLSDKLKEKYRRGIFSVPKPNELELNKNADLFKISDELLVRTSVYYGSRNNVPNEETLKASSEIYNLITSLTMNDSLIVVITGGGSAMLCLPKGNITLQDTIEVSRLLSSSGASISELNAVRRQIDQLKGGGIARLSGARNTISLIVSDVIGDDISTIASGPTVIADNPSINALEVVAKFGLHDRIPHSVIDYLQDELENQELSSYRSENRIFNCILGNNSKALQAMCDEAHRIGLISSVLTASLDGDCEHRSHQLVEFLKSLFRWMRDHSPEKHAEVLRFSRTLDLNLGIISNLLESISKSKTKKPICLLIGGEMPVTIARSITPGIGGRCSHMALRTAQLIEASELREAPISILFGASDGMDGATEYAGAFIYSGIIYDAQQQNIESNHYLMNCDSYNFFGKLHGGACVLKTGLTGTNVMDFITVLINSDY